MKKINYIFYLLAVTFTLSSCDFLDIVPDERPTEKDAFEDIEAAERFMYSCYAFLPESRHGSSSLDLLTGDEVVTAFEHETFASFPKGNFTAANPVISYWNTFFQGIKQCYILLNNIDQVPNLKKDVRDDYVAQAKFLIGYYHYLLARCYGPIILVKEEPSIITKPSDYLGRTNYDESVEFICELFDEAAKGLKDTRPVRSYGLATSVAAKSLKAKMLLYAASPLFNGNSEFFKDFKDLDGNLLMPQEYSPEKWIAARDAYKVAIEAAHAAGHKLYDKTEIDATGNQQPSDPTQRLLRYNILDSGNSEIIWADARNEGSYALQNKSLPYGSGTWNGVAPTLAMLDRFYTKNGLPISVDPGFDKNDQYKIATITDSSIGEVGQRTLQYNLDREPRFYAWIGFQGGYYEVFSAENNGAYENDESYNRLSDTKNGRLVCDFILGGNCARGSVGNLRNNNYSPTGYLNKKGVQPSFQATNSLRGPMEYPWPIIRLAELYLSYAEACVETGDLETAKEYINLVRKRAGIPTVEDSWIKIAGLTLDQNRLREIVRQERMIEFYLENQNFWDMRRWELAGEYFNVKAKGFNIDAESIDEFATVKEVVFERTFSSPTQYLLPIPLGDTNKNTKAVQNPGY